MSQYSEALNKIQFLILDHKNLYTDIKIFFIHPNSISPLNF